MLRHEQKTVRVALPAALHHSAGPKDKVEQNAAPRGQTTGASAREGEVHEKNDALRRQNTPHPGARHPRGARAAEERLQSAALLKWKLLSWVCHRWLTRRLKPSMVAPSRSSRRTWR